MAAKTIWGIDVGQYSLKAVKAVRESTGLRILKFELIEYDHGPVEGASPDEVVRSALNRFLQRNSVKKSTIVASMAGHSALIRFIKLPPVDRKKIPDIVKYEAHQQIPFPLDEVVWDYQAIDRGFIPGEQVEVGIFALRRELIHGFLANMVGAGIETDILQLSPVALYNFVSVDSPPTENAKILLDIGTDNTSLIIATHDSIWSRNLPIAGSDFTRAIERELKLPHDKAETVKKSADKSKNIRKLYEFMRPALRGLVDEIQRSLGFYKSVNPDAMFEKVLVFGSTFKLQGVSKYLSASLGMEVEKFERINTFDYEDAENRELFEDGSLTFGVSLGLVSQGAEEGVIKTNLMPPEVLNDRLIRKKRPYGVAAVAALALMLVINFSAAKKRSAELKRNDPRRIIAPKIAELSTLEKNYEVAKRGADNSSTKINELLGTGRNRGAVWLYIINKLAQVIPKEPENETIWLKSLKPQFVVIRDEKESTPAASKRGVPPAPAAMAGREVLKILIEGETTAVDESDGTFATYVQKNLIEPLKKDPYLKDVKMEAGRREMVAVEKRAGRRAAGTGTPRPAAIFGRASGRSTPSTPEREDVTQRERYVFAISFYVEPKEVPPLDEVMSKRSGGAEEDLTDPEVFPAEKDAVESAEAGLLKKEDEVQ